MTAESYTSKSTPIWISHELMDDIVKSWQKDSRKITFADYLEELIYAGFKEKENRHDGTS